MSTIARLIPANRTVYVESRICIIECASCSVDFGIGADFLQRRRDDHETFYCPNGHANHYPAGTSETEKRAARAERELEAARSLAQREARRRTRAEEAARRADYQARAAKGQLTKTKKRIANGVCPCCKRTFANLARHISGQHPDYTNGSDQ